MLKHKILPILTLAAALIAGVAGNVIADFTVQSGETYTLTAGETLTVDGHLTIEATGTLDASAANTNISLSGNWANSGTFTSGTSSTVTFTNNVVTSNITGNTSFYNFTCETASKQFTFAAGYTQTISNTLTLNGQASNTRIVLRSSTSGTRWTFDVTGGEQSVDYVDVKDSNVSSNDITANNSDGNHDDDGNNDDTESSPYWVFGNAASDEDGDGVTKEDEEAGPNGGDSNGDGIPDYTQANITTVPDGPGTSWITLAAMDDDGNDTATVPDITSIVAVQESSLVLENYSVDHPFGLLDFDLTLNGGETESVVTLYYHGIEYLTGYTFYHFNGTTNVYGEVTGVTLGTVSIGGKTVATATFTLVDGGQGDEGGVDGFILDPIGPGFPSGGVRLVKTANKKSLSVGDIVTYTVTIENENDIPVPDLFLEDKIPPGFKYIRGKCILDNQLISDPAGNRPLIFNIGDVASGATRTLKYQLVVGSGVTYGSDYENSVFAKYRDGIVISNVATETVKVVPDPLFDLGTTIGKVFHDRNGNGVQDPPHTVNGELIIEEPIGNVQIFTKYGAVITTDNAGRYHLASIIPGSHLFRLDERTLPEGAYLTTDKVVIANITPGVLAKVNFGVKLPDGIDVLEAPFQIDRDRGTPKPRLNVSLFTPLESKHLTGFGDEIIIEDGQLKADAEFRIFTNYQLFIEKWELEILDKDTMNVIKTLRGTKTDILDPMYWNGRDKDGRLIKADRNYVYRLTVTGPKGRQDVTIERPIKLQITDPELQKDSNNRKTSDQIAEERRKWIEEESKVNNLHSQTIVVEGETIQLSAISHQVSAIKIMKSGKLQTEIPVIGSEGLTAKDLLETPDIKAQGSQSEMEIILPRGEYEIEVSTKDEGRGTRDETLHRPSEQSEQSSIVRRHIKVGDDYLFFVAMGDAKMGYTFNRGDIEPVQQDDNFNTGLWAEGKLSYYLKGKVKGKYLITSSLDSERDRKELFKTLDPDKYYPVYGDGSNVNYKATDTQGILYLLIEWDKSSAQWGNYNTDFTDTEFAQFSRTLYGGKAHLESVSATKFGEPDTKMVVFKARAHQRATHNEFLGTGGSLYYLKNKDVIEGSEKVRIEIRDQINGVAMSSENMIEGVDYEMDYSNGRIVFWMPVSSVSESDTIISGNLLSGNPIYVVVDYEYEVIDRYNEGTYGARVQKSITDYVTVGATHVKESLTGEDYELQGVDVTVHLGKDVKLTAEYAKSRSEALSSYISTDGGLSFTELPTAEFSKGRAYGLKSEAHLLGNKLGLTGYYKWIDNDFSTSATSSQQGKELIGFGATYDFGTNTRLTASHDIQQEINDGNPQTRLQVGATRTETTSAQLTYDSNRLKLTAAARHQEVTKEKDEFESETNSEEDTIAAKAEYKLTNKIDVSLEHQATIKGTTNHQTTAGVEAEVFDWLSLRGREIIGSQGTATGVGATLKAKDKASISGDYTRTGSKAGIIEDKVSLGASVKDRLDVTADYKKTRSETGEVIGDNASLSASGKISDKTELHTTYAVTDSMSEDKISSFTLGSKRKINDNLAVSSDKTFASSKDNKIRGSTYGFEWEKNGRTLGGTFTREYAKGTTGGSEANIFGLTGDINDRWFVSGRFERRKVQNHDGTLTTRKASSFGLGYVGKDKKTGEVKLKASSKLELRYDEGDGDDHEQYLLYNAIEGKINPDTTLFANANLSRTRNTTTNSTDALYKEIVFGTAYRPVNFDWLNLMAKYTYLKDNAPVSQSDFNDIEKEKAHIFAGEAVIDVTDKWQLTEKLAYKTGEEKVTGFDFTRTQTRLWINRLGYNLYRDWQVFGEYRILDQKQAHDQKQGALVEVARDFGEFIQAGVGYNFTDFNDDLTHLDYTSQGPFIRITAKLFDRTPEEIRRRKEQVSMKKENREKRRLLKKKISDINKEAKKLYRKKLYDKAAAKFNKVLEIDTDNKTALKYLKLIAQKV
ncbi:MAG: choice-of-anchor U domain-containing protein [Candidatus Scalindua sp.]